MKSVSLHTLGCKLNYSETSTIANNFSLQGFEVRDYGQKSDIFVLNTCSVTNNADKECRQIIRSVLARHPETYIIVTGCYAQLQPEEIASINGVDLVLGSNEKFRIGEYIDNYEKNALSCIHVSPVNEINETFSAFSSEIDSRTRAFLKIQDGCDYKCSFCTIPLARGRSRSLPFDSVLDNAKKLTDSGYKEIILTGVNTGDYRYENNFLIDVLYEIEKLPVERIRVSSIEPNLLNDEIISFAKHSTKFCNHFHIPLQSGSDEILKLMRRRYNSGFYRDLIYRLNEEIDSVGIGVDVIVGFPGESVDHFSTTVEFLKELPVSYLHVFSYSERRNTDAAGFKNRVEISERRKRSETLRNLSLKKKADFYARHVGTYQSVLFETQKNDDFIEGYTSNYIRVRTAAEALPENEIRDTFLRESRAADAVIGEVLRNN